MSKIKETWKKLQERPILSFIVLTISENLLWNGCVALFNLLNQKYIMYVMWAKYPVEDFDSYISKNPKALMDIPVSIRFIGSIILIVITALIIWIKHTRKQKAVVDNIKNQNKQLSTTISEQADLIDQLRPLAEECRAKQEDEKLISVLSKYTNQSDIVESIQLYTHTPLIAPSEAESIVDVSFKFVNGTTSPKANINALFHINYQFGYEIYVPLHNLFKVRNAYFSEHRKCSSSSQEDQIQLEAIALFKRIAAILNNIQNVSEISDVHYAYYRILEILATLVIVGKDELAECKKLLKYNTGIEAQLKSGQRTGLLGTLFTETMYYFGNENSVVKKNRGYFTAPLDFKGNKMIMLVVLHRNRLRLAPKHQELECCKEIYDEIEKLLVDSLSERSLVCQ